MNMFTITYNFAYDQTDIKRTPTFENLDGLTKLDILLDALAIIESEYDAAREQWSAEIKQRKTEYAAENME